ncbi:MAG: sugar ABC transporter permease [Clostridia bacterium]|nr:sugar ABC transporter permease [Clostridia bacterium]
MDVDYYGLSGAKRLTWRLRRAVTRGLKGIGGFFKNLIFGIKNFVTGIFRGVYELVRNFLAGNFVTKLSYFIMGSGHVFRGQAVKGMIYFALQVLFTLYTVFFGGNYLSMFFENFFTGGNIGRTETYISDIWDDELNEYLKIAGDNSFHILLYGILSLFVILFFVLCYVASVKESYKLEEMKMIGKRPSGIRKEGAELLDGKFHVTLLSLPMAGLFLFTVIPLFTMILIAFTNYDAGHEVPERLFGWVGFENFRNMFSGTSKLGDTFRRVLSWTLIWAFLATFTSYFIGMLLAILINRRGIRFKKLYRTLLVTTIAVPQFVSLLIMSKMLDSGGGGFGTGGGIITQWIEQIFGYHQQFGLKIFDTRVAIILVNLWIGVPYSMLLCSGILMNIPADLYESARIDGASPARRFFKITLPYMFFVTGPYLITQFIGNINNFNVIYLLSGGGPGDNLLYSDGAKGTDLLITWLYKLSLGVDRNYKLASVIGILVFAISAVLSLIIYNRSSAVKGEDNFQ